MMTQQAVMTLKNSYAKASEMNYSLLKNLTKSPALPLMQIIRMRQNLSANLRINMKKTKSSSEVFLKNPIILILKVISQRT